MSVRDDFGSTPRSAKIGHGSNFCQRTSAGHTSETLATGADGVSGEDESSPEYRRQIDSDGCVSYKAYSEMVKAHLSGSTWGTACVTCNCGASYSSSGTPTTLH